MISFEKYNEAVREYTKNIFRFLYKSLKDEDAANDLLQDCYLKLWQNRNKIDPAKIKSWLFSVAHNAMIAEMRARGYHFAEIGRVLCMDHTSIMNAERRILEVQDLCTARGLTLRQYRDHIAETVKRRAPRNVLMFDGELLALRPKGKTDNGVQIWEVDRDR